MEKRGAGTRRRVRYQQKVKKAAHLLLFRHHRKPGVWGWELKRTVGYDYPKVLKILNDYLSNLDLKINAISEGGVYGENKPIIDMDKSRFYVTLKGSLTPSEAKMCGWRIDNLAALGIIMAYIISKQGKASRDEVEKILKEKLPEWQVERNLRRFERLGYISEDEVGNLYLDWRSRVEVDQKALVNLLLLTKAEE